MISWKACWNKDLAEGVDHAEDHPDVDHLGIGGGRQGAGQAHKAGEHSVGNFLEEYSCLQGGQDKEDGEVDLDDDGQVV